MLHLSDLRIRSRLMLALTLPLAMLSLLSSLIVENRLSRYSGMEKLTDLAELAPVISGLVHEMQKERGSSAGFIGSGGKLFGQKLTERRAASSVAVQELQTALENFPVGNYGEPLSRRLEVSRTLLSELEVRRDQVSGLELTVPDMARYYTSTIASLLSIVEEMASLSDDPEVLRSIAAYTAFLQAKERAGIERAMGSAGFGAGQFSPPVYQRFVRLIAMQETFLSRFAMFATAEQKAFLEKTVTGPAVDEVAEMRRIALDSPIAGHTGNVDAIHWFDTITIKIDLLRDVENRLSRDLLARTEAIAGDSRTAFLVTLAATCLVFLATIAFLVVVLKSITRPVRSLTGVMMTLSGGHLDQTIPETGRGDEIGDMARAVDIFRDHMLSAHRLEEEKQQAIERRLRKQEELEARIRDFEERIARVMEGLGQADLTMQETARIMHDVALETRRQSGAVARSAENASGNVSSVAGSAEELAVAITRISSQVLEASESAGQAVQIAGSTEENIRVLEDNVSRIGEIVRLINDIAEQTNLLALNATIEAARAGDAGKGFAVVASEVKNLASQTSRATGEISRQIEDIQQSTRKSVDEIVNVTGVISEISRISTAISESVSRQNEATSVIAGNIEQASRATRDVSSEISHVVDASRKVEEASEELQEASSRLSEKTGSLRGEISDFLTQIRKKENRAETGKAA